MVAESTRPRQGTIVVKSSELVRTCIAVGALFATGFALTVLGCAVDRYEYYESIVTVVEDQPRSEAVSLLGKPLFAQSGGEGFTRRQAALAAALRDLKERPPDPAKIVWVGRRLGYLWRMNDAVAVYTGGIRRNPHHAPLLRHRGHRFISLRRFDRAEADLALAARMIEGRPDQIEPDGMPNARNIPLTTTAFNVHYHLALTRYLQGDFAGSLSAHDETVKHIGGFDDNLVAVTYWRYLALRRLGRDDEAASVLEPVRAEMDIIENHAYHELLLMFKGARPIAELESALDRENVSAATIGYGLGSWRLLEGDRARAKAIFEQVVAGPQWPAFGFIAAEADLARMHR